MWMNVKLTMEDVIRHALTCLAHMNVPVTWDTHLQLIVLTAMVNKKNIQINNYEVIVIITDVDECQTNNGRCNHTCTNMFGSFECSCDLGYSLALDGFDCDGEHLHTY